MVRFPQALLCLMLVAVPVYLLQHLSSPLYHPSMELPDPLASLMLMYVSFSSHLYPSDTIFSNTHTLIRLHPYNYKQNKLRRILTAAKDRLRRNQRKSRCTYCSSHSSSPVSDNSRFSSSAIIDPSITMAYALMISGARRVLGVWVDQRRSTMPGGGVNSKGSPWCDRVS